MFWEHWFNNGILYVKDVFNVDGTPKALPGLNWLEIRSLLQAIPESWNDFLKSGNMGEYSIDLFTQLQDSGCRNRKIYDLLIDDSQAVLRYANRWRKSFPNMDYKWYVECFPSLYCCTKVTKYRDFQYRLNLGKIFTNVDLYDWGTVDSPSCSFCKTEIETVNHLFWECELVKPLIAELKSICEENTITCQFNSCNIIFNRTHINKFHVLNFITIFVKQYIYRMRCKGSQPSIQGMILEIEFFHSIEWANAKVAGRTCQHKKRWSPFFNFQESDHE